MKNAIFGAALALLSSVGMASAGGYTSAIVEIEPAVAETVAPNWSGHYVGVQYGQDKAKVGDLDNTDDVLGVFTGYRRDLGTIVVGAEVGYAQTTHVSTDIKSLSVKGQMGYDLGRILPYVGVGFAQHRVEGQTFTEPTYAVGLDVKFTENWIGGLEYQKSKIDIADTETIAARLSFKF